MKSTIEQSRREGFTLDSIGHMQELLLCYNRPSRPRLAETCTAIEGFNDPHDAWEHLLGSSLLPDGFRQNKRRFFGRVFEGETICPDSRPVEFEPDSIEAILTFASDPNGVLEAEHHAREFARRLLPWDAVCDDRIVWCLSDSSYEVSYLGPPYEFARDSVNLTLDKHGINIFCVLPEVWQSALPLLVRRALVWCEGWNIAVRNGFSLSEPAWIDLKKWRHFSDLQNPFESLLHLWRTGYRFEAQFTEQDRTMRLFAPSYAKNRGPRIVID